MRESQIQSEIVRSLKALHYPVWRMPLGGVRHGGIYKPSPLRGFPDLFGVCRIQKGRLFAIEVKTMKGTASEEQLKWLTTLNDLGCIAFIARSAEEAITLLLDRDTE